MTAKVGPMEAATLVSLENAPWLESLEYAGPKEALLMAARKIDGWQAVVEAAVEWAEEKPGRRPNVPLHDNVSIGSYARLLDALGLTAMSRAKLERMGENMGRGSTKPVAEEGAEDDDDDDASAGEGKPERLGKVTALRSRLSAT